MPASIGVNLRVTGHCRQGGRKYMEDFFSVAYQQTEDERDLEYAFFGIYDGHGGPEAAAFAKEHLMETIVRHNNFWSDNDEDVLRAIKDGYIATHYAMWKEQSKWPKLVSGLPSTAGTTASVAFIRRGKIYIGHVGDSGIILGYQEPGSPDWKAKPLTKDHKPESYVEMQRIENCGGKVVTKAGVSRVVWKKPRGCHQGPIRRSTHIDEIPFLAIARSLGDLWSYNSQLDEFIISPVPDCSVIPIDTETFRCLIFGTDGLYNMLSAQTAVHIVQQAERHNENAALGDSLNNVWLNPSRCLVDKALERWSTTKNKADNTSVVTLMLDPPGPPRAQVLKNRKRQSYPESGLQIVTRYEDGSERAPKSDENPPEIAPQTDVSVAEETDENFVPRTRESTNFERSFAQPATAAEPDSSCTCTKVSEENIQINEISSSSSDFFLSVPTPEPSKRSSLRNVGKTRRVPEPVRRRRSEQQQQQNWSISRSSLRHKEPKVAEAVAIAPKTLSVRKKNLLRKVLTPNVWRRGAEPRKDASGRKNSLEKPKKVKRTKENFKTLGWTKAQQSPRRKKREPERMDGEESRTPLSQKNAQVVALKTPKSSASTSGGTSRRGRKERPSVASPNVKLRSDLNKYSRTLRKRILKK